jgi:DNA repair exonuclease SbcCD ATPase subunit
MGTNRAEELANEYAKQFDFAEDSSPYLDFIEGFNASNKLRQSEIDELTKEKDAFKKECGELLVKLTKYEINNKSKKCKLLEQNAELTKEVENLKSALELWKNSYAEMNKKYIDKADLHYKETTRADLLQEEVERLKKEREELIDNFSGDKLMKQQKHFVSLYGSDEMGQEKANSFAVGFGKAAELMCNKLTTKIE